MKQTDRGENKQARLEGEERAAFTLVMKDSARGELLPSPSGKYPAGTLMRGSQGNPEAP